MAAVRALSRGARGGTPRMHVRVLFFASLREAAGEDALEVSLPAGATLVDLRERLAEQLSEEGARAIGDADVRVAINQRFVHGTSARLDAGDEVAFLPPVTGG